MRSDAGLGWGLGARSGFSPFFSFPGPPGLTRAADQNSIQMAKRGEPLKTKLRNSEVTCTVIN